MFIETTDSPASQPVSQQTNNQYQCNSLLLGTKMLNFDTVLAPMNKIDLVTRQQINYEIVLITSATSNCKVIVFWRENQEKYRISSIERWRERESEIRRNGGVNSICDGEQKRLMLNSVFLNVPLNGYTQIGLVAEREEKERKLSLWRG